jgi:gas vesicle protein GvpK
VIDIAGDDARQGLLGLVIALVEIVHEVCARAALHRVESGSLTDDEVERLGNAMADIEETIIALKAELGVDDAARRVRDQLDALVNDLVTPLVSGEGVVCGGGTGRAGVVGQRG